MSMLEAYRKGEEIWVDTSVPTVLIEKSRYDCQTTR